jgi:hypothetical protein
VLRSATPPASPAGARRAGARRSGARVRPPVRPGPWRRPPHRMTDGNGPGPGPVRTRPRRSPHGRAAAVARHRRSGSGSGPGRPCCRGAGRRRVPGGAAGRRERPRAPSLPTPRQPRGGCPGAPTTRAAERARTRPGPFPPAPAPPRGCPRPSRRSPGAPAGACAGRAAALGRLGAHAGDRPQRVVPLEPALGREALGGRRPPQQFRHVGGVAVRMVHGRPVDVIDPREHDRKPAAHH